MVESHELFGRPGSPVQGACLPLLPFRNPWEPHPSGLPFSRASPTETSLERHLWLSRGNHHPGGSRSNLLPGPLSLGRVSRMARWHSCFSGVRGTSTSLEDRLQTAKWGAGDYPLGSGLQTQGRRHQPLAVHHPSSSSPSEVWLQLRRRTGSDTPTFTGLSSLDSTKT